MTTDLESRPKINEIVKQILEMCHQIYNQRPNCSQILDKYSEWGIDKKAVVLSKGYGVKLDQVKSNQNKFFIDYLKTKLKHDH